MTPRQGRWIAVLFVVFVIAVTMVFSSAGCAKKEPPIGPGVVQDKSHYPESEVKHYDCDRNGENCELDRVEKNPERCTLTVKEDNTGRVGEVTIPCSDLDSYKKGDRWPKGSSPSPAAGQ